MTCIQDGGLPFRISNGAITSLTEGLRGFLSSSSQMSE
jgi:hypothetical protein